MARRRRYLAATCLLTALGAAPSVLSIATVNIAADGAVSDEANSPDAPTIGDTNCNGLGACFPSEEQGSHDARSASVDEPEILDEDFCSIWLAPSSLKGHPGDGVYTTRSLNPGDVLFRHGNADGISIYVPLAQPVPTDPNYEAKLQLNNHFDHYWWGRGNPDHFWLTEGLYETAGYDFQPTFGALPNHHCLLDSLDAMHNAIDDSDNENRKTLSPTTGAISASRGRTFYTRRHVGAGEELFLNYGHCDPSLFDSPNYNPSWAKFQILLEDYKEALQLMTDPGFDLSVAEALPKLKSQTPFNERVLSLMPKTQTELDDFRAKAKESENDAIIKMVRENTNARTPEWIKENGICLETIRPGASKLPDAGRGAFGNIRFAKDSLIVPAPLLHITNRTALDIYLPDGRLFPQPQLLLNYCMGHPQSSLLLCPDTNAMLINHCSSSDSTCKPNAALRWSAPTRDTSGWLDRSIAELAVEETRVLQMDVYATRDIAAGEEILLDYGEDFEKAWQTHKRNWDQTVVEEDFISSAEANSRNEILPHMISDDPREDPTDIDEEPLDDYLFTACPFYATDDDWHEAFTTKDNSGWEEWSNDKIVQVFASNSDEFREEYSGDYRFHEEFSHWPCTVVRRDLGTEEEPCEDCYWVRIHQNPHHEEMPWHTNKLPRLLHGYPRHLIRYFVHPGKGEQHHPKAFRYPIGIPDELMPEQWKNL